MPLATRVDDAAPPPVPRLRGARPLRRPAQAMHEYAARAGSRLLPGLLRRFRCYVRLRRSLGSVVARRRSVHGNDVHEYTGLQRRRCHDLTVHTEAGCDRLEGTGSVHRIAVVAPRFRRRLLGDVRSGSRLECGAGLGRSQGRVRRLRAPATDAQRGPLRLCGRELFRVAEPWVVLCHRRRCTALRSVHKLLKFHSRRSRFSRLRRVAVVAMAARFPANAFRRVPKAP
jgi:hypothetical protein